MSTPFGKQVETRPVSLRRREPSMFSKGADAVGEVLESVGNVTKETLGTAEELVSIVGSGVRTIGWNIKSIEDDARTEYMARSAENRASLEPSTSNPSESR